jgi:hypothetical protein
MVKQGTWLCPTIAVYYDFWPPENTPEGKVTGSAPRSTSLPSAAR